MTSVEIKFDNEDYYFPGQNVTGKIEMNLRKNIKVKKLILAIRGRAKVEWMEHKYQITGSKITSYRGNDTFFNSIVPLISNKMDLRAGNHEYEFEFKIPQNCPASSKNIVFNESYESYENYEIKYEAVVYFVRPYKFDLKFDKEFKVLYGFDLNLLPTLQVPILCENEAMIISIARSGYVAEEETLVNVQIKNPQNGRLNRIVCSLNKIVSHTFISKTLELCSTTYDIQVSEKIAVFSPGQAEYKFWLDIPGEKSPPSTVLDPFMKLVNIQYKLIVQLQEMHLGLVVDDLSVIELPIIIGAIPIQQTNVS